ncbi:MAG TPA: 3-hydroxyacyl-CoA dehydrogenase NAD-binding domain-containing protein [Ktedonobacterales bacterium]|nr:3-hydroxyacyl-CoA dehydrogenase NAD-binding domain-containing protein [Ktedonobacterales bacterium]
MATRPETTGEATAPNWRVIGVVGGGAMGSGIAYEVARNLNAQIVLREVDEAALERARANVTKLIERPVQKGQVSRETADGWLARFTWTTSLEDLADTDLVVEAVFEQIDLKRETFAQLDHHCRPDAILASNTSGLPITQIAAATRRPERVLGLHFFNPVPAMKLVEIVRAYQTSDSTIEQARAFCAALKKETILAKDYPGFITTRIGLMMIAEAIRCLDEGIGSPEDIDKGMRLAFNHPMGPLALADLVGLDVVLHVLEANRAALGERFLPSPLLRQMVTAGYLGRKSGRGFYSYE